MSSAPISPGRGPIRPARVFRKLWLLACLAFGGVFATASVASGAVVYDNVPSPLAGNYISQAFQATQTSEFGGQARLDGTDRQDPTITVTMSSWACQSNPNPCTTTPGATFSHPITLNLYGVLPSGEPGSLIASVTQTFNIPFRPSAEPAICGQSGGNGNRWSQSDTLATCFNGFANNITFDLAGRGITLPDRVIVALAYNTQTYGENPTGTDGPYNSLNVGLAGPPTVGSLPRVDDAYINSTNDGNNQYCGNGGPFNIFRLSAGCWWDSAPGASDLQPMVEINATTTGGPVGPAGPAGPAGPTGQTGAAGGVAGAVGGTANKKKCKKGSKKIKGKCTKQK
jgi:hypothetical protein